MNVEAVSFSLILNSATISHNFVINLSYICEKMKSHLFLLKFSTIWGQKETDQATK